MACLPGLRDRWSRDRRELAAQDALLAGVVRPAQRSSVFSVRLASMNAGLGTGALIAAGIVDMSSAGSFVALYLLDAVSFLAAVPPRRG